MAPRRTRRDVLLGTALLGSSLAGCLDRFAADAESTPRSRSTSATPASTHSTTDETRTRRTTTLPLSAYSFDWMASLRRPATETQPPEVRLGLTNTASKRVRLGFGPTPPFSHPVAESSDTSNRLVLSHPEMGPFTAPDSRVEGCWRLRDDALVAVYGILRLRWLEPGETVSGTYTLYNAATNEGCFPDGTYAFGDTVALQQTDSTEMGLRVEVRVSDDRIASVTTKPPTIPAPNTD